MTFDEQYPQEEGTDIAALPPLSDREYLEYRTRFVAARRHRLKTGEMTPVGVRAAVNLTRMTEQQKLAFASFLEKEEAEYPEPKR